MSLWFLVFLSVLQGVTELFPVSSLGHTLLVPALFGMHIDKHAPQLLPFLVALHLGTALALLWYFRARWIALISGFFAQLGDTLDEIDFHKGRAPESAMRKLRRLFLRSEPSEQEVRLLRGILADTQRMARLAQAGGKDS